MFYQVAFTITLAILCTSIGFADISQLPFSKDQNASSFLVEEISIPIDRNLSKNQNASIALAKGSAQLENATHSLPVPWVADMFYQALSNFTVHDNVGTAACQKQVQMYVRNLKNNSYWAVRSKCIYIYMYNFFSETFFTKI